MTDRALPSRLATEAGGLLLALPGELTDATAGEREAPGGKRSHAFLMEALAGRPPGDAALAVTG